MYYLTVRASIAVLVTSILVLADMYPCPLDKLRKHAIDLDAQ